MSEVLIPWSNIWHENVCNCSKMGVLGFRWSQLVPGCVWGRSFVTRLGSAVTGTETGKVSEANLKGPWESGWWPWSSVVGQSVSGCFTFLSSSVTDCRWLCLFWNCLYFSPLCSRLTSSNLSPLPLIGVDLSGAEGRPPLPHLIGLTLVDYHSVIGCMERGWD